MTLPKLVVSSNFKIIWKSLFLLANVVNNNSLNAPIGHLGLPAIMSKMKVYSSVQWSCPQAILGPLQGSFAIANCQLWKKMVDSFYFGVLLKP